MRTILVMGSCIIFLTIAACSKPQSTRGDMPVAPSACDASQTCPDVAIQIQLEAASPRVAASCTTHIVLPETIPATARVRFDAVDGIRHGVARRGRQIGVSFINERPGGFLGRHLGVLRIQGIHTTLPATTATQCYDELGQQIADARIVAGGFAR